MSVSGSFGCTCGTASLTRLVGRVSVVLRVHVSPRVVGSVDAGAGVAGLDGRVERVADCVGAMPSSALITPVGQASA